jgi:hypothetical protein
LGGGGRSPLDRRTIEGEWCGKGIQGIPEPFHRSAANPSSLAMSPLGRIPASPTRMLFFLLAQACSLLLDFIGMSPRDGHDKDIEILLLRQQLRILQRNQQRPPRISRWERLTYSSSLAN